MENYKEGRKSGNVMNLHELKIIKDDLENNIHKLLEDFEDATGMRIESVDVYRSHASINREKIHGIDTKINFNWKV